MSDEEEDLGALAWPGFVDILSSVIIMFVFFVMVVASALYFHIIIFKNKILSEVSVSTSASSKEEELASTNRSLTKQIEELTEKMKLLEEIQTENEIQLYQVNTEFSESTDQELEVSKTYDTIKIFFGKDSISITEENEIKVGEFIANYLKEHDGAKTKAKIIAVFDDNSKNNVFQKKLAVSRMLNARNIFLETPIKMENVSPKISANTGEDGATNWVEIKLEEQ